MEKGGNAERRESDKENAYTGGGGGRQVIEEEEEERRDYRGGRKERLWRRCQEY